MPPQQVEQRHVDGGPDRRRGSHPAPRNFVGTRGNSRENATGLGEIALAHAGHSPPTAQAAACFQADERVEAAGRWLAHGVQADVSDLERIAGSAGLKC